MNLFDLLLYGMVEKDSTVNKPCRIYHAKETNLD